MMDECRNDCTEPLNFPKRIHNRPGLTTIRNRIGSYSDFREAIMSELNRSSALQHWTYREPDDPGIALIEGAAILGDILSFYQDLYINEAYLATAKWRESVADLVRLLGYRLSPGVGGEAPFAFLVKGADPVTIPQGFPFKTQLESLEQPADFETREEIKAYPSLSYFNLYHPTFPTLPTDRSTFPSDVTVLSLNTSDLERSGLEIKEDDRLILLDTDTASTTNAEIVVVKSVEEQFEKTNITINGSWSAGRGLGSVIAYKLGRSYRHFGHNAPSRTMDMEGGLPVQTATTFTRKLGSMTLASGSTEIQPSLYSNEIPLDCQVDDLSVGGCMIIQGKMTGSSKAAASTGKGGAQKATSSIEAMMKELASGGGGYYTRGYSGGSYTGSQSILSHISGPQSGYRSPSGIQSISGSRSPASSGTWARSPVDSIVAAANRIPLASRTGGTRTEVRTVTGIRTTTMTWGAMSGPCSIISMDSALFGGYDSTDIREFTIHETAGPGFVLGPARSSSPDSDLSRLDFYGDYDSYQMLHGRKLGFLKEDGSYTERSVTIDESIRSSESEGEAGETLWPLYLDSPLEEPFLIDDFPLKDPTVTVYGNVVNSNQGKTQDEIILGNGDSRTIFQTFMLPKSPLTYYTSADDDPPEVPELDVCVDDIRWERVTSFFGRGAEDHVYIVREDTEGNSWVQFGDGRTGKRLPSGVDNIIAYYRIGTGAYGSREKDTTVRTGSKLEGLDKIHFHGVVSGGADPETGDNARMAAPGKTRSLGRLVSLQDFESEAQAIPGVSKVSCTWGGVNNIPSIVLTVLMETGRDQEYETVRKTLASYDRKRGPQRFPIKVRQGFRQAVQLTIEFGLHPDHLEENVKSMIQAALGVVDDEGNSPYGSQGLFSEEQRRFGQYEYLSRITGIVQQVEGVLWSRVISVGDQIIQQSTMNGVIHCSDDKILYLCSKDLNLTTVSSSTQGTQPIEGNRGNRSRNGSANGTTARGGHS